MNDITLPYKTRKVLPDRYERSHGPTGVLWSTVSKAADRSRRQRTDNPVDWRTDISSSNSTTNYHEGPTADQIICKSLVVRIADYKTS